MKQDNEIFKKEGIRTSIIFEKGLYPETVMFSELYLKYSHISTHIRKIYAHLLVSRAVRFYINNYLDADVVKEDLTKFCIECDEECPCEKHPDALCMFSNLEDSYTIEIGVEKDIQEEMIKAGADKIVAAFMEDLRNRNAKNS